MNLPYPGLTLSEIPYPALLYNMTSGEVVDANDAARSILGYQENEVINLNDINHEWQKFFTGISPKQEQETTNLYTTRTGITKLIQVKRRFIQNDDSTFCLELLNEDSRNNHFMNALSEAAIISRTDLQGTITFVNKNFEKISGYSSFELLGQNHRLINSGHHEKSFWIGMWKTISQGRNWRGQVKNKRKDGTFYWVDTFIMPLKDDDGGIYAYMSIRNDISAEKHHEEQIVKLNKSLTNFQDAIHKSSIVSRTDQHGVIQFVNENFVKISGYQSDELIGRTHKVINSGYHPKTFWVNMWKTISSGNIWRSEVKNRAKDGSYYWVDTFIMPFLDDKGNIVQYLSIRNDITERKHVEQALEHSLVSMGNSFDYRFQKFAAHIPGFLFQLRLRSNGTSHFPFATKGMKDIFGVDPSDVVDDGSVIFEKMLEEDKQKMREALVASGDSLSELREVSRVLYPDNNIKWIETVGTPQFLEDDSILWSGYVTDVTERRLNEIKLKESHDRYLSIIEQLPGYVFRINPETNEVTFISGEVLQVTGYEPEDYMQNGIVKWREKINKEDATRVMQLTDQALRNHSNYEFEYRLITKEGKEKWIWERGKGIYDEENKLYKYEGFATDVTPRKKAEEKMLATLKEKELLVKEIHHRVKNNLQVISSIIFLKTAQVPSEETKVFMNEMRQKIRTISLIHERLLETEHVSDIDISDYLSKLIIDLQKLNAEEHKSIQIKHEIGKVFLHLDQAVYCGLILNEVVTNAIKHAFADKEDGVIKVSFSEYDNQYEFIISQNGIPIPTEIGPGKTGSFGMQLLDIFLKQLHASCTLNRDGGTQFIIRFPVD